MSVFRIHKSSNFTVMSNYHFKEKEMSLKAKGLLSLMLSLPEDWNYSVSGLCRLSKDGKDSVMSALAELEKFGYLTRVRTTNSKGQFSGIEYNIFEQPQEQKPVAEKPILENEQEEKPILENQPQLNTNKIKELNNKELKELNTQAAELESIITSTVVNEELRGLYRDFVEMRESINKPITKRGLAMLIQRCERLSNMNLEVQKILLETAIVNNWKNVYSPKEENAPNFVRDQSLWRDLKSFYNID